MDGGVKVRSIVVHMAVIDDGDLRHKRKRVIEYLVDHAIAAVCFVNGRHKEYDLDAMADADCIDGLHLGRDFPFVANT
jgi:hypothetical protein